LLGLENIEPSEPDTAQPPRLSARLHASASTAADR